MACRWAGSQDAEDLAHEAWEEGRDASSGKGRGWWAGVVRNRWKMRMRSNARRRHRERAWDEWTTSDGTGDPERQAARYRLASILYEELQKLDPVDQRIVMLRHCDDWNASEIAAELSLPAATVRTRCRRALARLRGSLEERWGAERRPWQWGLAPMLHLTRSSASVLARTGWIKWWGIALVMLCSIVLVSRGQRAEPELEETSAQVSTTPAETWSRRRVAVRRARAERISLDDRETPGAAAFSDAADALAPLFFQDAATGARAALGALGQQASESLKDCARTSSHEHGVLEVRAQLIAEPDVGTVVEWVEVREDTVEDPELLECVRESAYTFDFPEASSVLFLSHDFTVDMESKQVAAAAVMPLDELPAVLSSHPEYLEALPDVVERFPAIVVPLRKIVEADPSLRETLPALLEVIDAADASPIQ